MTDNLINWNEIYSVGHSLMDEQHRQLISVINKLFNDFKAGIAGESVSSILDEMIEYSNLHFISEETLLKNESFPGLEDHHTSHEAYQKKILEFRKKIDEGISNVHYEVIEYLKNWWNNHILKEDMNYAKFLNFKS